MSLSPVFEALKRGVSRRRNRRWSWLPHTADNISGHVADAGVRRRDTHERGLFARSAESLEDRTLLSSITSLDTYVAAPDASYEFTHVSTITGAGYTGYVLDQTSQTYRTAAEVDNTEWQHWVTVIVPDTVTESTAFLRIGSGSNGSAPTSVNPDLATFATYTNSVVIDLPTVPNQPLTFTDDGVPRWEDSIIAYTFDKYHETGDDTWPLLLAMVNSAVRTMDTVQTFVPDITAGTVDIDDFVVTGQSKRGWTTWLTAAVDPRVTAIAPQVIDVLNMQEQIPHHLEHYQGITELTVEGASWVLQDYVDFDILDRLHTPEGIALGEIVDPYNYLDRQALELPKYIVNSAGDQFFVPDSSQFYFHDLPGQQNYLRYVPNTGHSLNADAEQGILYFYDAILDGAALPEFSWTIEDQGSTIRVNTVDAPVEVRLWQATNLVDRDFRQNTFGNGYADSVLTDAGGGEYVANVAPPPSGATAFFVEMTYMVNGTPIKFTTDVSIVSTYDYGDAPAPYPTLFADDGARHVQGSGLFLGSNIDDEPDGQPDPQAFGDDNDGSFDDGAYLTSQVIVGRSGSVDFTASGPGYLNLWVDFNIDGDWDDPGEHLMVDVELDAGVTAVPFQIPLSAIPGTTFVRARFSSVPGLDYVGLAPDGEVEDYPIDILPADIVVQDAFGDIIDGWWTIDTDIPQGGASVIEQNGQIELRGRGHLITTQQYDPLEVGPLHVSGTWTFVAGSGTTSDYMQILTRSDGTPGGPAGETQNGIEFAAQSTFGGIEILERVDGNTQLLTSGNVDINVGDTFFFEVVDDGTNVSLYLQEIGGDGTTGFLSASSTIDFAQDHVVFHNREGAGETLSYIDYVNITVETGEIHGMKWHDLDGDGVFDPGEGETPLEGWEIYLDLNNNGSFDPATEPVRVTDANGEYSFLNFPVGDYTVAEVAQPGWEQTFPIAAKTQRLFALPHDGSQDIVELDPVTGLEVSRFAAPEATSGGPEGLAFDGQTLFFISGTGSNTLWELDPDTGLVLDSTTLSPGASAFNGMATLGGKVYLLDFVLGDIWEFDPTTKTVTNVLDVDGLNSGVFIDGGLAAVTSPDRLVAIHGSTGTVVEIDPASGLVTSSFAYTGPTFVFIEGLAVVDGQIYLGDNGEPEYDVFSRDGTYLQTVVLPYTLSGLGGDDVDVAVPTTVERLFAIPIDGSNDIVELDPLTGAELNRFAAPEPVDSLVVNAESLAFDGQVLYLITGNSSDTLWELDPDTGAVLDSSTISVGSGDYQGLAALDGKLYTLDYTFVDLLEFDPLSNTITNVLDLDGLNPALAGSLVHGLAGIAAPDRLVSVQDFGNAILEIDPSSGLVTSSFTPTGPGTGGYVEVAIINGDIYVGDAIVNGLGIDVYSRAGSYQQTVSLSYTVSGLGGDAFPQGPSGAWLVELGPGEIVQGIDFGNQLVVGEIHGLKWNDLDGDGQFEPGSGEQPLAGWQIYLDLNNNGMFDPATEPVQVTDANGEYSFVNLLPGNYTVAEIAQPGWEQTFPGTNVAERLFALPIDGSNDIVELDPFTGAELNRFAAPEPVDSINVNLESLAFDGQVLYFIAGNGSDTLWELDPDSGTVLDSTPLSVGSGDYQGLAALDGKLYTLDYSAVDLLEFDPLSNTITNVLDLDQLNPGIAGSQLQGLSGIASPNRLVSVQDFGAAILEIDPGNGLITTSFTPTGPGVGGYVEVAIIDNDIYVGDALQNGLGIDVYTRSGAFQQTVSLPYTVSGLGGDVVGAAAERLFAVPLDGNSDIVELDPITGAELNRFAAPIGIGGGPDALAFDGAVLYFLNGTDTLYELDPDTGALVDSTVITGGSGSYDGLATLNGYVYVLDHAAGDVLEFDPISKTVTNVLDVDGLNPGVSLVGGLSGITGPDRLVATDNFGSNIVEIDPASGAVTASFTPSGPGAGDYAGAAVIDGDLHLGLSGIAQQFDVYTRAGVFVQSVALPYSVSALGGDDFSQNLSSVWLVELGPSEIVQGVNFGNRSVWGEIHGMKWNDIDGDGQFEPGDGETPLEGWEIYLDLNNNGSFDPATEPVQVTDANGEYWFSGLVADSYRVAEIQQPGWTQTSPQVAPVLGERLFAVPADGATNDIVELDPLTGLELNRFAAPDVVSAGPDALAFDGQVLYFLNGDLSDTLYELDPNDGTILDSTFISEGSGDYDGLAVLNGLVYVLDHGANDILEFDPVTNLVTNILDVDAVNPGTLVVGGLAGVSGPDRLVATVDFGATIVEIDPTSGAVTASFVPSAPGAGDYAGVAVVGGELYLGTLGLDQQIDVYDRSGAYLQTLSLPYFVSALGGDDISSQIDVPDERLFGVTGSNNIIELDPTTGSQLNSFLAPEPIGPSGLAFDGHTLYYISSVPGGGTLYELDPDTGAILDSTPLGSDLFAGLTALAGKVYVLDEISYDILEFDPVSNTITNTLDIDGLNGGTQVARGLAGSPDSGQLWALDVSASVVFEIDPATGLITDSFAAAGPNSGNYFGAAVIDGEIYLGGSLAPEIDVYAPNGDYLRTVSIPDLVDALAAGPAAIISYDGAWFVQLQDGDVVTGIDFGNRLVDTTPPVVTLSAPSVVSDPTPEVTVDASDANGLPDGTLVTLDVDLTGDGDFNDGGEAGYATSSLIGGSATFEITPGLSDGNYNLRARVSDLQDNEGTSTVETVLIDTTPPAITLSAPSATADTTPEVTVTATDANGLPDGTFVTLDVDLTGDGDFDDIGESGYTTSSLIGGSATFEITPALADGSYDLRARVSDLAGNEGTSSISEIVIETVPPVLTDIVARDAANGQWRVALSTGSSFDTQIWGSWNPANTYVDVFLTDVDGDGLDDLIGRNDGNGQWLVSLSTGTSFAAPQVWATWNPTRTYIDVQAADFNNDGLTDIAGRDAANGQWRVNLSTGTAFGATEFWATWNPSRDIIDVQSADFNGDGRADIAGRDSANGVWRVNLSTGTTFGPTEFWTDWNPTRDIIDVLAADFDGDGLADIAGRDAVTGVWRVNLSTGTAFTGTEFWTVWNPSRDIIDVQAADFDGDGKTDIAGRDSVTGVWRVNLSTGSAFTGTEFWTDWNPSRDIVDVHSADLNGDGRADITGRDAVTGVWRVNLSTGSSFTGTEFWGSWNPTRTYVDVNVGNVDGAGSPLEGIASTGQTDQSTPELDQAFAELAAESTAAAESQTLSSNSGPGRSRAQPIVAVSEDVQSPRSSLTNDDETNSAALNRFASLPSTARTSTIQLARNSRGRHVLPVLESDESEISAGETDEFFTLLAEPQNANPLITAVV